MGDSFLMQEHIVDHAAGLAVKGMTKMLSAIAAHSFERLDSR